METNSTKQQLTGMKKRQQIASANKMIFVWVIIASVVLSLCGVTIQFLFRQAAFNQKIIGAKSQTQTTLTNDLKQADTLKKNVDALLADGNLAKVKANDTDTNLKVILDALPTTDDKSALGASLQQVILPKSGVKATDITTISPTDISATVASNVPTTSFSFTASGNYEQTKNMLSDIEHTIRPINLQTLSFQSSGGNIRLTAQGVSYYLPEKSVKLGTRTIKP